jgi:hypothetical protein
LPRPTVRRLCDGVDIIALTQFVLGDIGDGVRAKPVVKTGCANTPSAGAPTFTPASTPRNFSTFSAALARVAIREHCEGPVKARSMLVSEIQQYESDCDCIASLKHRGTRPRALVYQLAVGKIVITDVAPFAVRSAKKPLSMLHRSARKPPVNDVIFSRFCRYQNTSW